MDTRKIMLIVGALIIAIGAAFGVNQMMRGSSAPTARAAAAPEINGPMILVATRQLPTGTIIGPDSFRYQPWPKELVEKAYFLKDKTDVNTLVGTVVRYPITAGQPLTQGSLVHPDDRGFLAAALAPGMRAVTVKVSQEQGVAGFVFPGDRVDVLLAQTISVKEGSSYPDDQPLRPLAENTGELEAAIASGDVNVPTKGGSAAERRMMADAAGRPTPSRTATTGGDVSRFWIPVSGRVSAPRPPAGMPMAAGSPQAAAVPIGPVVRVTRGDKVTAVPVGGK